MAAAYALSALLSTAAPAAAQGLRQIRDTEIENLLREYSLPIFRAANLGAQRVTMRILGDKTFNAFVADGRSVYINIGTLMDSKTPNEVIGVIAHETGHIIGGHLAALRNRVARDQTKCLLLSALGIALAVGGAASGGDTGREVTGLGGGIASSGCSVLMRSLLAERRAQESAADQAGLDLLQQTRQSGMGMLRTFERFADQELVSANDMDPFVRSHPVATDRLAQLRRGVMQSPYANEKDPESRQLAHDMVRAKLAGFTETPGAVFNAYPASDTSLPARYARAIARNCSGHCAQAIGEVDALIRTQPGNPYFWELKGEILVKSGRARDAIEPLKEARKLLEAKSRSNRAIAYTQTTIWLARALLDANDPAYLDEAIALLTRVMGPDKPLFEGDDDDWMGWHQLAIAYERKGRKPDADLATAQKHFYSGGTSEIKAAKDFATRAQRGFARGSPGWIRAGDIMTYKAPNLN
jgi:predicted Zn-dependent protease